MSVSKLKKIDVAIKNAKSDLEDALQRRVILEEEIRITRKNLDSLISIKEDDRFE